MDYKIDGQKFPIEDVDPNLPSWRVILNGEDITDQVKNLGVINDGLGMGFMYGKSITGGPFNQGHFYNRGGAVIVVAVRKDRELYVAALDQVKPLQRPWPILELPRGQSNFGEGGFETALRELGEETGLLRENVYDLQYLGRTNPDNSLYFGDNVHNVSMFVQESEIDWGNHRFRADSFRSTQLSRTAELIKGSRLVPLKGFKSPSSYAMTAIGLFRAHLDQLT